MSDTPTKDLIAELLRDYAPVKVPACPVCGGPCDGIAAAGMGRITYCCSSAEAQPMGSGDRFEACMDHFSKSRYETRSIDSRIAKLCELATAATTKLAEVTGERDEFTKEGGKTLARYRQCLSEAQSDRDRLAAENAKMRAAQDEAHSTDRIKTREINLLTEENRKLISVQEALRTGGAL